MDELALRVRAQQNAAPLVPVPVVVSSAGVERAVRMGMARLCGVAANLDVSLLTRFAAGVVESAAGARVAAAAAFEAMALALFLDPALLGHPDVEPLRRYLDAAGDDPDALDTRRVQLAARVGRIFEQYSYSRGDMLAAWLRGEAAEPQGAEEIARWQRRLYVAMLGEGGVAAGWTRRGGAPSWPSTKPSTRSSPRPPQRPPAFTSSRSRRSRAASSGSSSASLARATSSSTR